MTANLPKIAWIGIGIMGSLMSENLIKAGYDVTGFTLEQDKLDRLAAAGGTAADSIADAVRDADVVITMVPASRRSRPSRTDPRASWSTRAPAHC
ncbi:NAD-dependent L-serine dehydrogenase [Streptomyces alboniger]